MMEGTQHVGKGRDRVSSKPEDLFRGICSTVQFSYLTGAYDNPARNYKNASILRLSIHDMGILKRNLSTEPQRESKVEPKETTDKEESNVGLPKSGNGYGNGDLITDNSGVQATIKEGQPRDLINSVSESTSMRAGDQEILEDLYNLLRTGKTSEYRVMCNISIYKKAYHELKSKPGNMTPAVDAETLDGMSLM